MIPKWGKWELSGGLLSRQFGSYYERRPFTLPWKGEQLRLCVA